MFELLKWGETFVSSLRDIGDWLITTPGNFDLPLVVNGVVVGNIVIENPFGSVGTMLIGTGIITILAFKLVKFFTDLVL